MKQVKLITVIVSLILSLYLVVKGQTIASQTGLFLMLLGVAGLLVNLYFYNKKHV